MRTGDRIKVDLDFLLLLSYACPSNTFPSWGIIEMSEREQNLWLLPGLWVYKKLFAVFWNSCLFCGQTWKVKFVFPRSVLLSSDQGGIAVPLWSSWIW